LDARSFHVVTDPVNTVEVTGASFADPNSGHMFTWRKTGNSGQVNFTDEDSGSSAVERWSIPESETLVLENLDEVAFWTHDGSRFRLSGGAFYPFFNTEECNNDDIIIHNGTRWFRSNIIDEVEANSHSFSALQIFNSGITVNSDLRVNENFFINAFTFIDTGQVDDTDLDVSGENAVRFSTSAPSLLTGMTSSGTGQVVWLINDTSSSIPFNHNNPSSAAGNRFVLPGNTTTIDLLPNGLAIAVKTTSGWHVARFGNDDPDV
jgi:hypothetical protein